ncbi:MAG: hypothetical protein H7Z37_12905, partial [Pyrinomonadaceae bacterium]|nr:hypothetical protein [Pyrinomonadaceae bacterium]
PDGRRTIDYKEYLGLEKLLDAQTPASKTPDERVFITTHQLFEIAFKQMIFDLSVVAETFTAILHIDDDAQLKKICINDEDQNFWLPAVSASNRLRFTSEIVLPNFFSYLDKSNNINTYGETFSSAEYLKFRPYLPPASGLQSAQFRVIQRAFCKGKLFELRLFPAQEYKQDYDGERNAPQLVKITSETIMRDAFVNKNQTGDSKLKNIAKIDDLAHEVLKKLARFVDEQKIIQIRKISGIEVENAVEQFRRILSIHRKHQEIEGVMPNDAGDFDEKAVANFREDLMKIVIEENTRRESFNEAQKTAVYLSENAPNISLTKILNQLVATDDALHGSDDNSFLSRHLQMAADRIRDVQETARMVGKVEQPAGTGGGGVPYLINIKNNLVPLFPFLVAFR